MSVVGHAGPNHSVNYGVSTTSGTIAVSANKVDLERMRAKEPNLAGFINRGGVRLAYEIYGTAKPTLLFVPTWSLAHARNYKRQIPYFSRYFRCITWDPRGNGKSDRPTAPESYGLENYVDDAIAIMDSTGTKTAVLFGYSLGGYVAHGIAAHHPERVRAVITIGPVTSLPTSEPPRPAPAPPNVQTYPGWRQGVDREYWRTDYENFSTFFVNKIFSEPHSTMQIEECLGWAADTTSEVIVATLGAPSNLAISVADYQSIACPMLTIHGEEDAIISSAQSEALAETTGCEYVPFPKAGHGVHSRFPAKVNLLVRDFLAKHLTEDDASPVGRHEEARGNPSVRISPQAASKVLMVSSSCGLGQGRRDLAIANVLRTLHPNIDIQWLAQDPLTRLLAAHNERVHPASRTLASGSAHLESESGQHTLRAFEAFRRMDEILIANFMTFQEIVESEDFDLVVADNAWGVDQYWHEHPELKRSAIAWLSDCVGWMPMPQAGKKEALLTRDYNAEMIDHVEANPSLRDCSIFLDASAWASQHFQFTGYPMSNANVGEKTLLRNSLQYEDGEVVCVVAVGGTAVGASLIRKILAAYPIAKEKIPALRMIVMAGPRLSPKTFDLPKGVECRAFVPNLDQHLAACDIALVQGGLATTMELTAAGTPFLYFPLEGHFEQNLLVPHRLRHYSAGRKMLYGESTSQSIVSAMLEELSRSNATSPVERDGAERAAKILSELL